MTEEIVPAASGAKASVVLLLGRTSKPTCGVNDYCSFLGNALRQSGLDVSWKQVQWAEKGRVRAMLALWRESKTWRNSWIVLQYTAGAWSGRGLPFLSLAVVALLRLRRVRVAVMFHEPYCWETSARDPITQVRSLVQTWVIQRLYTMSDKSIFSDPLETVGWLPRTHPRAVFVPIGGNIPGIESESRSIPSRVDQTKNIVVFCLSDPPNRDREIGDIAGAMKIVVSSGLLTRLVFIGKGTAQAANDISHVFEGMPVAIVNRGIQSPEEISYELQQADAMLCVRGSLFPRRGSALAGVACEVPIIAYAGSQQYWPLAEAGIKLVPHGDREALGIALKQTLTDCALNTQLRARNRVCQHKYFSWKAIARRYVEVLGLENPRTETFGECVPPALSPASAG